MKITYTATFETASEETESAAFSPSYDNATIINSSLYNKTASGSKSQRLSAANANEIVGLARSLSVMPGDTVQITAYGKYYTPTNTNSNAATAMLTSIAQAFGVSGASSGEALKLYNRLDEMFGSGFFLGSEDWEDEDAPKAFLNYILFDKDFVPYDMGWDQIDASALETGTNVAHDELTLLAPVTKAGYIYIYLSNENNKLVDVYFDDLTIQRKLSPVIQQDDYYAFGLNFNSYRRENATANQYLYNGKEKQDELDLGWMDYGARMYQPEIGRWGAIDYLSEKFNSYSPYNYVLNNPTALVDPDGNDVYLIIWFTAGGEIGHVGIAADNYKKEEVKDKDGNVVKDENGNAVTREVADGTVTYYDFYGEGAGIGTHDKDVTGNIRKQVMDKDEMYNSDFGTGNGSANGIIQLNASPNMTQHIAHEKEKMYQEQEKGNPTTYNGEKFNCSDFAKAGLNQIPGFYRVNGSENINIPQTRYNAEPYNKNITTPNFLFRSVKGIIQAGPAKGVVLKETGNANKDYVDAISYGVYKDKTPNQ